MEHIKERNNIDNTKWMEYPCRKLVFEDHDAIIVYPDTEKANGYLAVKTEYWGAFPEAAEILLLEKGFYLCYIKNGNRWGTNVDLDRKARFIRFVQHEYGLKEKCVPIGMSCGGLIAIKLAARYPELIKCMYLDAPVLNYMSCPCGFGVGNPLSTDNSEILQALCLRNISQLLAYRDMPLDKLDILTNYRIPVVMVAGDNDKVVPFCENGIFLQEAYRNADVELEVYIKPGCDHHPHGLKNPTAVINFILKHCD